MPPPEWIAWLGPVAILITLISAAAAAAAYFRATNAKATIELQSSTITSYEQRLAQVESELAHYKADSIAARAENEVLRGALSGRADVEHLGSLLENHHRQVMDDRAVDRRAMEASLTQLAQGQQQIMGMLGQRRHTGGEG